MIRLPCVATDPPPELVASTAPDALMPSNVRPLPAQVCADVLVVLEALFRKP